MHNLLKRQFRRYLGDLSQVPEQWRGFIQAVNEAYREFDADRAMLERSLELSSQELLQANSEMRAIFQAIPDLLFRMDCEGAILDCTAGGVSDFFGNPRELIGKRIHDVFCREAAGQFTAAFKSLRETNSMAVIECRLPFNERNRYFEARLIPLLQDQMIAIVRDITDKKETENKLKESERRLDSIIQASPIPAFVIGKDHRVIHWNKALEELSRLGAAEVIGTTEHWKAFYGHERPCLADLRVDDAREAIEKWYPDQQGKPTPRAETYEATCFFPDLGDEGKWLHVTAATIRNSQGDLVGAIETIEDITERKRSEKALEKAFLDLRELNFIVNKGPAIAFLWRATDNWPVEFISDNIAQFGYTPDEFTVGKIPYVRIIHPDDLSRVCAEVQQHTRDGLAEFTQEYRIVCKSGEIRWIDTRTWVRRDADGRVTHYQGIVYDITERKKTEDALVSANRQLNDIIEFLPDATIVFDMDNKVIAWNRAIEEMTGVSKKEMIGKGDYACTVPFYGDRRPHLPDLIDADDQELESRYKHVTRKGGILYSETDVPKVYGGKGACVFATAGPLFDAHGNRVGAIESIRDITEQKRAEVALKRSEEKYRELVESANSIIMRRDSMGKVTFVNEFAQRFFGYSEEEILGKNVVGTIVPKVESTSGRDLQSMIEDIGQNPDCYASNINENMRRGGERVWVAWTNKPIRDENGRVVEILCVGNDITERKLMEEAVARAEEKYRDIFENAVTGIYLTTLEGRFLSINKAFARILHYDSPEEVLNSVADISRQLYVNPERRSELLRLIEERGMVQDFEVQFFRKDNSVAWVTLNIRAVHGENGETIHLEGTVQDITDSKLLESQLHQSRKMEAIGTLAGGIAHDFNNILAPIIGYTELSLDMVPTDGRLSHNMRQVLLSANRAKDLVRQILTFSRKTEHKEKPVQVCLIIEEALKLLRSSLPSTIEIRQTIHEDAKESTTVADPTQIHQVLVNLCTNAAHAMRAKGGTLTVALENVDIGPRAARGSPDMEPGPFLKLSVVDTGHGMEEAVRQRIFDPYFTTKGPTEGTGLGLAVVYGIVKSLSGAIAVSSKPGKGTTFDLYFPRTRKIQPVLADFSAPLPKGHGLVLVVDDERFIVDMVKEMLDTLGYETVPRYSSPEALESFRTRPESFDLVITDMTMPHMTGTDLAREIFMIRPDTPLILCTGFSEKADENTVKLLGIKKLLMKPVSMRDLAVAVSTALTERKSK
jgi:PAS domain S-box-containing protein